jgi:alpha/beta superfamily hydrolase
MPGVSQRPVWLIGIVAAFCMGAAAACGGPSSGGAAFTPAAPSPTPPITLLPLDAITREVTFTGELGVQLAGQFDLPPQVADPPLVFFIHHSGPETRDIYQHLAAYLVPRGYAVFRFDKRGTGRSGGSYGCCEAEDALAAYQAAYAAPGLDHEQVFIVAQSLGTQIVAEHYTELQAIGRPAGVVLLSSLLKDKAVLAIQAPIHIIVSDSEAEVEALSAGAVNVHRAAYAYGASYFVAPDTEHTLFDITAGPIDWSAPDWPEKFSAPARQSLLNWLDSGRFR